MTVPEFLPVLSAGAHPDPKAGACVMEYVSLLAGEPWSDSPSCTHPVLAATARRVNDALPDSDRQQLVPLIGRLFGTAPTGTDHDRKVLSVRLAVWSARQVLHPIREQDRAVCTTAIDTAEAWCDGRATEQECRSAAANANAAAYAANAAAYAANANAAAYAANAARGGLLTGLLTGLLDEYDRLTGRTATPLDAVQWQQLVEATA